MRTSRAGVSAAIASCAGILAVSTARANAERSNPCSERRASHQLAHIGWADDGVLTPYRLRARLERRAVVVFEQFTERHGITGRARNLGEMPAYVPMPTTTAQCCSIEERAARSSAPSESGRQTLA
jgi:hypothetical protein